jgi:hypothetical protein
MLFPREGKGREGKRIQVKIPSLEMECNGKDITVPPTWVIRGLTEAKLILLLPVIPATQKAEAGGSRVLSSLRKVSETLSQKNKSREWAGYVTQMVECLPTTHKALGSIPNTRRKKNALHVLTCKHSRSACS